MYRKDKRNWNESQGWLVNFLFLSQTVIFPWWEWTSCFETATHVHSEMELMRLYKVKSHRVWRYHLRCFFFFFVSGLKKISWGIFLFVCLLVCLSVCLFFLGGWDKNNQWKKMEFSTWKMYIHNLLWYQKKIIMYLLGLA